MKKWNHLLVKTFGFVALLSPKAFSYPLLSSEVRVAVSDDGLVTFIYRDHNPNSQTYWYLPISIEPVKNMDGTLNLPIVGPKFFNFAYRGQIKAPEGALKSFATSNGIRRDQLVPIPFEYSRNVFCQDFVAGSGVNVDFPKMVGNYGEIVPITISTRDQDIIPYLDRSITQGKGLSCTVDIGFKAVAESYAVHYEVDMKSIYERFEAELHGSFFVFETNIHTQLEKYRRDGYIKITKISDNSILTEIDNQDEKAKAAFDGVMDLVVKAMFERTTKLPDGPMVGREKAFSLRADFRRNKEELHFTGDYQEQGVIVRSSQIPIRVSKGNN